MTNSQITIRSGGSFWMISVNGKITDVGVNATDGYRVYKRAGECGLALADKLGDMIGRRVVAAPKHERQTTEAALLAAIAAAI
jgi:hypothetical protein